MVSLKPCENSTPLIVLISVAVIGMKGGTSATGITVPTVGPDSTDVDWRSQSEKDGSALSE